MSGVASSDIPTSRYSLRSRQQTTKTAASIPSEISDSSFSKKKSNKTAASGPGEPSIKNEPLDTHSDPALQEAKIKSVSQKQAGPKLRPATGKRKRTAFISSANVRDPPSEKLTHLSENVDAGHEDHFDRLAFTAFLHHIEQSSSCHRCSTPLIIEPFIDRHVESWSSLVSVPLSGLPCPLFSCDGMTCIGCGGNALSRKNKKSPSCCEKGWYAAVWFLLSYFDSKRGRSVNDPFDRDTQSLKTPKKGQKAKSKTRRGPNPRPPRGTGYADGNNGWSTPPLRLTEEESPSTITLEDRRECRIFQSLAGLIRAKPPLGVWSYSSPAKGPKRSNKTVRATLDEEKGFCPLNAMFHWSKIMKGLAELFLSGSIQEAHDRADLYLAALDLLVALKNDEASAVLVRERTFDAFKMLSDSCRGTILPSLSFGKSTKFSDLEGVCVASALEGLAVAAKGQLEAAEAVPGAFKDKASQEQLAFCRRIYETFRLVRHQKPINATCELTGDHERSLSPPRFATIEDAEFKVSFTRLMQQARIEQATTEQTFVPTRMRTLFKEMGVLRASLPDGIFVRVASDRPDMLKFLVVGPDDTPYEGGLFEFWMLCPQEYPSRPPLVHCATAARPESSRFHLNPNLYSNGYVCLSLIGTWQGSASESWQPGRSTLLQVIVSIQSMILGTPTPADNEPGGLYVPHKQYNQGVQAATISAAMLAWLLNENSQHEIWKDVIDHHFRSNASKIMVNARNWSQGNEQITKHPDVGLAALAHLGAMAASSEDNLHFPGSGVDPHIASPSGASAVPSESLHQQIPFESVPGVGTANTNDALVFPPPGTPPAVVSTTHSVQPLDALQLESAKNNKKVEVHPVKTRDLFAELEEQLGRFT